MDSLFYNVYIQCDKFDNIIAINSDGFIIPTDSWILVDSGTSDLYYHAQNNYLTKTLFNDDGIYQYKYVNSKIIEKTEEEIAAELAQREPENTLPSPQDDLDSMIVDHEYRLTLLELGLFE